MVQVISSELTDSSTMTSTLAVTFFSVFLIDGVLCSSQNRSDLNFASNPFQQSTAGIKNVEKRSVITFPPTSLLQINMGVTLAGQFERNSAVLVLAFQQNLHLPSDVQPFLFPSSVVSARKFSIYEHLRDVITSYGFPGVDCLQKMICQIGEAPLIGGLLEDVVTFALSPSKHRGIRFGDGGDRNYLDGLLEAERLGKIGGNCSSAFPNCVRSPLDLISAFIRV